MTRHIVSVGGSGQHVGLALTRLAYMGALRSDLKLIAIDPDNQSPLPKLLEAPAGMRGERHPLRAGPVFAPFDVTRFGATTFQGMFADADHPQELELFEMLFDADSGSIPISKGMYGTPCVGASVFAEGAGSEGLQNLLKPLANSSQVFVCGSVVGGTGAGVMHKLVGEIRNHYQGDLFGIFLLPWFEIGAGAAKGAITPAIIQRNAKHGIKYFYEHTIPRLTASLLIGYPGTVQRGVLKPTSVQEGILGEVPHFLHLAAASAVVQLPKAHTIHRGVKAYGIVHDPNDEGWLLDAEWDTQTPSLRTRLRAHKVQLNLLEFLCHHDSVSKLRSYYGSSRAKRMISSNAAWGDALHQSIDANQREATQQAAFLDEMYKEFRRVADEVKFCVEWMDRLFPENVSKIKQDHLLETLSENSLDGSDSPTHWKHLRDVWSGKSLMPGPNRPMTAAEVARHHAKLLLEHGLSGIS